MGFFDKRRPAKPAEIIPHVFLIASLDSGDREVELVSNLSKRTSEEIRREVAVIRLFSARIATSYCLVSGNTSPELRKEFWWGFDLLQLFLTGGIPQTNVDVTAAAISLSLGLES